MHYDDQIKSISKNPPWIHPFKEKRKTRQKPPPAADVVARPLPDQSPINQIPEEVLLAVFFFFPGNLKRLLSVCKYWREVIMDCSMFWTTISLLPKHLELNGENQLLPRLKFLINLSGSMPLDVIWTVTPPFEMSLRGELFEYFFEHAPFCRWRTLIVYGWDVPPEISAKYLSTPTLTSSILQKLSVERAASCASLLEALDKARIGVSHIEMGIFNEAIVRKHPIVFGAVTTLSALTVTQLGMKVCPNISTLSIEALPVVECDMPQLRTLRISAFDVVRFARFNAPSLEHLEITKIRNIFQVEYLILPRLLSLTITEGELWPISRFKAKTLQTLCIENTLDTLQESTGAVNDLIHKDNYSLRPSTLILSTPLEFPAIVGLLKKSPDVKQLTVSVHFSLRKEIEQLIQPLISHGGGSQDMETAIDWALCPNLTSIELRINSDREDGDEDHWGSLASKILNGRLGGTMERASCSWQDGYRITVENGAYHKK